MTYLLHNFVQLVGHQRSSLLGLGVDVLMKHLHDIREHLGGLLVQVGHTDSGSQSGKIRVASGARGSSLSSKLIQLEGGHARIQTRDDLLRNDGSIHMDGIQAIAQLVDSGGDFVKRHILLSTVSLNDKHFQHRTIQNLQNC